MSGFRFWEFRKVHEIVFDILEGLEGRERGPKKSQNVIKGKNRPCSKLPTVSLKKHSSTLDKIWMKLIYDETVVGCQERMKLSFSNPMWVTQK